MPGLADAHATDMRMTVIDLDALTEAHWFQLGRNLDLARPWMPTKPLFFHWIVRDVVGRWFAAGHIDRGTVRHEWRHVVLNLDPTKDYVELAPGEAVAAFRLGKTDLPADLADVRENDLQGTTDRGAAPARTRTASKVKLHYWLGYDSHQYHGLLESLRDRGAIRLEQVTEGRKRPLWKVTVVDPSRLDRPMRE